MKFLKSITVAIVLIFGLSGCYTELQYSQKMRRVTDENPSAGYSGQNDNRVSSNDGYYNDSDTAVSSEDTYYDDSSYTDDNYVPVYYKDYQTANYWDECGCNPYSYNRGYNDGYNDAYYYGQPYYNPFYSSYFGFGFGFGHRYLRPFYGNRFGFGITFGYYPYYDYYYGPSYGPYGYGGFGYNAIYYSNYYGHPLDYRGVTRNQRRRTGVGSSRLGRNGATDTRTRSTSVQRNTNSGVVRQGTSGNSSRGTVQRTTRTRTSSSGSVQRARSGSQSGSRGSVTRSTRNRSSSQSSSNRSGKTERRRNAPQQSRIGFMPNTRINNHPETTPGRTEKSSVNVLRNARSRNQRQHSVGLLGHIERILIPSSRRASGNQHSIQPHSSGRAPVVRAHRSNSRSSGSSVRRTSQTHTRSSSGGHRSSSSGSSRHRH